MELGKENDTVNDLINNKKENKNFIGKIKESFSGRKFRSGAYATIVTAIVIIIVLVVNMIVSKADLKIDLSSQKMYTLTDDTVSMLKELKDDITIYYLQPSSDTDSEFYKIAQKYDSISGHIKLVSKDTVLYPKFASNLGIDEEVTQNSFIVVNNKTKRAKYIDSSSMLIQETDYQTYQTTTTGIDVEGKLTSAIQYVTSTDLPVMYVMEGHGETETGTEFKAITDKLNVTVKTLNIITQSSIPEDCNMLFINTPKSDFSENEVTMVKDYMKAGGNVIITLNYATEDFTNFKSLLEYYGMEFVPGMVYEGNNNMRTADAPYFTVPNILRHDITKQVKNKNAFVISVQASGLTLLDTTRSSLTIEPLLQTSDESFSKKDYKSPKSLSKEEGDIGGPFYEGLLAKETYGDVTSNMAVYPTELMFYDDFLKKLGNGGILSGTISYMSGDKAGTALAIPSKSTEPQQLNVTQGAANFWGTTIIIILPIFILVAGIIVCVRRRKR
jgi:ABC-2 type transport system permease protein